jgi:hypothetical protein
MNKKIIATLSALMFGFGLFAQTSYVVEYDKKEDAYSYVEIVYTDGKKVETPLKKMPKLNVGDVVTVRVKNYNPFLYHVEIRQKAKYEKTGSTNSSSSMLTLLGGGLTNFSMFTSALSGLSTTRSEAALAANEAELDNYIAEATIISDYMSKYQTNYKTFASYVKDMQSEGLTKTEADNIAKKLRASYSAYKDPSDYINEAYPRAKMHYNKAGVIDNKVKSDVQNFDYEFEKFRKVVDDPMNSYTKKGMEDLIVALETAKFEMVRTFEVVEPEASADAMMAVDGTDLLTGMIYEIKFYDLQEVRKMSNANAESEALNYVKYYYEDRFWDPQGNLVDAVCAGCEPVLRAEGLYRGNVPRNFDNIVEEDDLGDKMIGKWIHYSRDGEVERVDLAPELTEKRPAVSSSANTENSDPQAPPMDLSNAVTTTKKFEAPMAGAIKMNMSTGMYGISSFSGRKQFICTTNEFGDSATVTSQEANNLKICIGSNVVIDFPGNKAITPSVVLGAAVDFWDEQELHFVTGGGIKFKKFPFIGINGGVAFTRVNQLVPTIREGIPVSTAIGIDSSTPESFTQKKYVPGYYFGLSLHF